MTTFSSLQSIKILSDLKESTLKKIEAIARIETYKKGHCIFKENDYADKLYSLIEGKISLEVSINSTAQCRIKDVFPTESFGISSIVDTGTHTYIASAIAVQDCKVFSWQGDQLEKLFYEDKELGFLFMRNAAKILKKRLYYTRAQLAEGMCAIHKAA